MRLKLISDELAEKVDALHFEEPVCWVYNPLKYARETHHAFLDYAKPKVGALLLGMNPGPWGMVQTGVPFGEIHAVREWLKISARVVPPERQHPKRPTARSL